MALKYWEISHTPGAALWGFFGRAADVYACVIQCKAPFHGEDHDG
jgi:hypothetical protein